jgi:hypothetical protein
MYIRMNIRNASRSGSSNTKRLSTTREIQWYIAGFDAESFQLTNHRDLRVHSIYT